MKFGLAVLLLAVALAAAATPPASEEVPYPAGYRSWRHVKSVLIGPQSPQFATAGGFHHIYANECALAGYATGTFADGSVLVFDRIGMQEQGGVMREDARLAVDVMVRDAARYAATGGWGFEEFRGGNAGERTVREAAKTTCFGCHSRRQEHAFVFSTPRD